MSTAATKAYGTKIYVKHIASASFLELGNAKTIVIPEFSRELIETTNHGSPNGIKEYVSGLGEYGNVSCQVLYKPSAAASGSINFVRDHMQTGQSLDFKIEYTDGAEVTGSCIPTMFKPTGELNDVYLADFEAKATGLLYYS